MYSIYLVLVVSVPVAIIVIVIVARVGNPFVVVIFSLCVFVIIVVYNKDKVFFLLCCLRQNFKEIIIY